MSVIALRGRIGEGEALSFEKTKVLIEEAFDKSNLVAVAMLINSVGGSPVQSQLIASYLLDRSFLCILTPVLMSSLKSSSSQTKSKIIGPSSGP